MSIPHIELMNDYEAPLYRSGKSAWRGHIPFAYFISRLMEPKSIVELGVHAGDSYCAWCQYNPQAQIRGIDLWGRGQWTYDEDLEQVRAHHDLLYAHRSSLIQSTFKEGMARIPDGSVELMHIDGHHEYADVRRDYEDALPKLATNGVILFHDTTWNLGHVDQLWNELTATHDEVRPRNFYFNFQHTYGLGVLPAYHSKLQPKLQDVLQYGSSYGDDLEYFFRERNNA